MRLSLGRIVAMIMRHLYLFPRTLERWAESIYWPVARPGALGPDHPLGRVVAGARSRTSP